VQEIGATNQVLELADPKLGHDAADLK
jgi:hypothetical protein